MIHLQQGNVLLPIYTKYLLAARGNEPQTPKTEMKFGDKRGAQPPATPRTALQKKYQLMINAREYTCFADIVGILENTLVAEKGLTFVVVFSVKSYILFKVGDKRGIISE